MKKVILLSLAAMLSYAVFSQVEDNVPSNEQKQLTKAEKKELRTLENEKRAELTQEMVKSRQFVLEADYIGNQTGNRIPVNSTINFVEVDTTHIVIQLGSMTGIGYNGVGGITTEGQISSFKTTENKKGDAYTMRIITNTLLGNYDIVIFVNSYGNANATISGTTYGKLNYYGRIVPVLTSRIYKGRSL